MLEQMFAEGDARSPDETGGMLLGYRTTALDVDELVIVEVIGPGPRALHHRHRFEPDGTWQQERLEDRYRGSGRITTYLGDWHTHPGGRAAASWRDVLCAHRIAGCRTSRTRHPLMLILGAGESDGWRPRVFRYTHARLRPVDLRLLDHERQGSDVESADR